MVSVGTQWREGIWDSTAYVQLPQLSTGVACRGWLLFESKKYLVVCVPCKGKSIDRDNVNTTPLVTTLHTIPQWHT